MEGEGEMVMARRDKNNECRGERVVLVGLTRGGCDEGSSGKSKVNGECRGSRDGWSLLRWRFRVHPTRRCNDSGPITFHCPVPALERDSRLNRTCQVRQQPSDTDLIMTRTCTRGFS
jgi:hypothetical protein